MPVIEKSRAYLLMLTQSTVNDVIRVVEAVVGLTRLWQYFESHLGLHVNVKKRSGFEYRRTIAIES